MNMNPKISVVTVCYNAVAEIERTIKSVINQTYSNVEYIIIDGGSKDGTVDIIKKYADKITYWVSEPDKGIYDAMNKGIIASSGDWINFMNAGDWFSGPRVLNEISQYLSKNRELDIIYGSIYRVYENYHYEAPSMPLEMIRVHQPMPHQATFVKLSYHKKHLFDISYRSAGDTHFFYHAYYSFQAKFLEIPIVVAYFEATYGMSTDQWKVARLEDMRLRNTDKQIISRMRMRCYFFYRDLKSFIKKILFSPKYLEQYRSRKLISLGYKLIPNSQMYLFEDFHRI